jgi:hypothetical protein
LSITIGWPTLMELLVKLLAEHAPRAIQFVFSLGKGEHSLE